MDAIKVGDNIGIIKRITEKGVSRWTLTKKKVTSVYTTEDVMLVRAGMLFYQLNGFDIISNTKIMEGGKGVILTDKPFILNNTTLTKARNFIKHANEDLGVMVDAAY